MSKFTTSTDKKQAIQEKRNQLKTISQKLKIAVEHGEISSINEGLINMYHAQGHRDLKTLKEWNDEGKRVKKGEKALLLWGKPKRIKIDTAERNAKTEGKERSKQYFPLSYVFSSNQVQEEMVKYKSTISKIRLVREKSEIRKVKIQSSKDVADYVRPLFEDSMTLYEETYIVLLNRANNTEGFVRISQGGIAGTVVDIRLILKYAIEILASGVILVHNHPSGNTQPSHQDLAITRKLKEALKWFDISLFDHLIMTENSYYSLADNGVM